MFRPVGSQPPAVYWRRRLLALAFGVLVVVLLVLTVRTVLGPGSGSGSGKPAAAGGPRTHPDTQPEGAPRTGATAATGSRTPAGSATAGGSAGSAGTSPRPSSATTPARTTPTRTSPANRAADAVGPDGTSRTPAAAACEPDQLAVRAVVGRSRYQVGERPVLTLQVTNTGERPCVQDVADSQIHLQVYNGASRVWGSHDCQVEPGATMRTLEPGRPAGFSVVWSGLSSQPHCAGPRQRVGAGTYTLYARLSGGDDGKTAQFVIS